MSRIAAKPVRAVLLIVFTFGLLYGGSFAGAEAVKLDLNTATVEQLETLKGIGPELAQRIVAYRNDHGPFRSIDDLIKVKGIGARKLAAIQHLLMVNTAEPISAAPSRANQ
ncbi:MAG: helix-hairpin-helix domain-containing protein [Nitrospirae bacterium]|nr:MAG: helix-hairpin-helix domain-containing protein [Nitrospirota bacterium]